MVALSRLDAALRPLDEVLRGGHLAPLAGCGVGIATGAVVGIDIDILDGALAIQLAELATSMLGDTPCLRIGRAPKRLLVYRAATPFAGRKRLPLEVLARGQQFVAHAVHPDTRQPYAWPWRTACSTPRSPDCPCWTRQRPWPGSIAPMR